MLLYVLCATDDTTAVSSSVPVTNVHIMCYSGIGAALHLGINWMPGHFMRQAGLHATTIVLTFVLLMSS
jgi:hypothetical protein